MLSREQKQAFVRLGVVPGDDPATIRSAWRRLVRSYHPDQVRGDKAAANARLAELNAAFDIVITWSTAPDQRAKLDARARDRAKARRRAAEADAQRRAAAEAAARRRADRLAEQERQRRTAAAERKARAAAHASLSARDRAMVSKAETAISGWRRIASTDYAAGLRTRALSIA